MFQFDRTKLNHLLSALALWFFVFVGSVVAHRWIVGDPFGAPYGIASSRFPFFPFLAQSVVVVLGVFAPDWWRGILGSLGGYCVLILMTPACACGGLQGRAEEVGAKFFCLSAFLQFGHLWLLFSRRGRSVASVSA